MPLLGVERSVAQLEAMRVALNPAIQGAASPILRETLEKSYVYCPIDMGPLINSGFLHGPRVAHPGVTAELTYGGGTVTYGVQQHENLTYSHKPPTQAKYLQRAVDEHTPDFANKIAGPVSASLRQAIR